MFSSLQPNIPRDSLIKPTDTTHDTPDKKHNDIENVAKTVVDNTLLDFDIQESVSKLESDIMKTVENNNNKLKELAHLLNEEKKSKHLTAKVVDEEDVLPIVETISGDEVLEIVTKPASIDKVEEDYVVEDVSLLKKLIAETDSKQEIIEEKVDVEIAETTAATTIETITTERQTSTETPTTTPIQTTTVELVTILTTPMKVRLFEPEVSLLY